MPTFSAIAFDRLIEPDSNLQRRHITPNTSQDREEADVYSTKFDNRAKTTDNRHNWTRISPALYATPESTPIPGDPSSFPPSPYIINHKRRGPWLIKSFCEDDDVATWKQDEIEVAVKDDSYVSVKVPELCVVEDDGRHSNGDLSPGGENGVMKSINTRKDGEVDDIVDPQDSVSVNSESEDACGAEVSLNLQTPFAEFYDAWEELSSENGPQLQTIDIQSDLSEMRLSLSMEIEKRKQAEETLYDMRKQWQRIREKLSHVGLTLPEDPTALVGGDQHGDHAAESFCQQVYIARFVSNSIGKGIAKAEVEMEMEARLKTKNIEIARLWDRLHYYEAVNQEMSQRNQQVVETTRRLRQQRKRRQKWVIAAAVTLGSAVLVYSYFKSGISSLSSSESRISHTPKVDCDTN